MLFELMELPDLPLVFNDRLWNTALERVSVYADRRLVFRFRDGKEITERLEK